MPVLNIASNADDWRARRLSNFSDDAFTIDGERMASVEGFIQGIKFFYSTITRQQAFESVGVEAKRLGRKADKFFVWWGNHAITYGSSGHHKLIERAIRAKFEQNKTAMDALLATHGMMLTHDLDYPEAPDTSLPAEVFCDILTRIREEILQARK